MNKGIMIGMGIGIVAIILGILFGTGVINFGGDTAADGVNIAQPTTKGDIFKNSKYSNSDVSEIKELASETCKQNSLPCRQNNILVVQVTAIDYNGDEEQINLGLEILTPYTLTILDVAEFERNYEEYTNDKVKELLADDSLFIAIDGVIFNTIKGVGRFESVVVKEGEKIYTGNPSGDYTEIYLSNDYLYEFGGYKEFYDKEIRVVLVGAEGELEIPINLKNYK